MIDFVRPWDSPRALLDSDSPRSLIVLLRPCNVNAADLMFFPGRSSACCPAACSLGAARGYPLLTGASTSRYPATACCSTPCDLYAAACSSGALPAALFTFCIFIFCTIGLRLSSCCS